MKKSKVVQLVLITSLLASCKNKKEVKKHFYMRGDSTANYQRQYYNGNGSGVWFYAFRPYGYYDNSGLYHRAGHYSNTISQSSNTGRNSVKSNTVRGGFGSSSRSSFSS